MNTEILIGICGLALTLILYIIDKIINGSTRTSKKYLLDKWLENREKNMKLQYTISKFADKYNGWASLAFNDSNLTYHDYYSQLQEKFSIEYSDAQFRALKKEKLAMRQIDGYIEKLRVQEDNLNMLQTALDIQIKKFVQ